MSVVTLPANSMRFLYAIWAAMLVTAPAFRAKAQDAPSATVRVVNGINAIVHDSIITFEEVQELTDTYARGLEQQYAGRPEILDQKLRDAYKQNLDTQIEKQLVLHEFDTAGYKVPESIIDEQLDEYVKSKYGNRVTLTKTLQQEGMTFEKFRQNFRDRFIVDTMHYENIAKQVIVSPHKIETYYIDHKDDFKEEDQVKLRMIVLTNAPDADPEPTRKLAQEILGKLNEGAAFGEMASIYSQGSQASKAGEWDWVEKSVLRKELADVAFNLKPGERSGVIETPGAFYIMLVEDKRQARVRNLSDVRDDIEKILLAKERDRLQQQWLDKLRKKTYVREFPF